MTKKILGYIIKVNKTDSVNTVGVLATSVWFGGCSFRCEGCYNPETWKLKNGKASSFEDLDNILKDIPEGFNLSLLGGDPLENQNLQATKYLISRFKSANPNKDVLIWTGRPLEVAKGLLGESIKHVDYLKVGQFEISKFKRNLKYYGSENQKFLYLKDGEPKAVWSDELQNFKEYKGE